MQNWYFPGDPDRVESLKAASLTGAIAGLVGAVILLAHRGVSLGWVAALGSVTGGFSGGTFWVSVAIATVSGSLFGVTYRYAVRQDHNLQIQAGVILAFSVVRGLALVNVAAALELSGWPFLAAGLESLLLFALAGSALEWAMGRKWVGRVKGGRSFEC